MKPQQDNKEVELDERSLKYKVYKHSSKRIRCEIIEQRGKQRAWVNFVQVDQRKRHEMPKFIPYMTKTNFNEAFINLETGLLTKIPYLTLVIQTT